MLVFEFVGYPEGLCGLLSGLVALKGLARGSVGRDLGKNINFGEPWRTQFFGYEDSGGKLGDRFLGN